MMKRHPRQFVNDRIVRCSRRFYHVLCGAVGLFALTACSPEPAALDSLVDYQNRVANTLEREAIDYQAVEVPRLPAVRDLRIHIPRVSISLLDSWRMDQCAASSIIAERNSALGKLEHGMSRYHTDLALTAALQQCVDELESTDSALAERLTQALKEKRANLAASKQQAIATDKALRHTLRIGSTTLSAADEARFGVALNALETVVHLLQAKPVQAEISATDATIESGVPDHSQIEQALENLHQSDYLPQLWRTLFEQQAYLQRLSPLITELAAASGCSNKATPQRAEVLHRVFLKYFIGEVQPQLAQFTEQGYRLNQRLQQLQEHTELPVLKDHIGQLAGISQQLNQTSKEHVQPWQDFFAACGFTPGG